MYRAIKIIMDTLFAGLLAVFFVLILIKISYCKFSDCKADFKQGYRPDLLAVFKQKISLLKQSIPRVLHASFSRVAVIIKANKYN